MVYSFNSGKISKMNYENKDAALHRFFFQHLGQKLKKNKK